MTGGCGDNANMTNDLKNGMAFTLSNWSTYDSWLWGNRCSAQSCSGQPLNFTNIKIKTGGSTPGPTPGPTPTPTPSDYTFGNACGSKWADECNGSCNCKWSWPSNDPA